MLILGNRSITSRGSSRSSSALRGGPARTRCWWVFLVPFWLVLGAFAVLFEGGRIWDLHHRAYWGEG